MPIRFDFDHSISDSPNERRLQQEALARLRATRAAQAVLDREQAAKDANDQWVRQQVAASRPAPVVGQQRAARDAMIRRQDPTWTPEPAADPARVAAAMRMDALDPRSGQAKARELMLRRQAGR